MHRSRTLLAALVAAALSLSTLFLVAASPAQATEPAVGTLLINEVQLRPPIGGGPAFVELYNPTSQAVDLGALWFLRTGGQNKYLFGTVGAGEHLVVPLDGNGDNLSFPGGPTTLELSCTYCGDNGAGGYKDVDKVSWNASPEISVGRCPDGAGGTPGVLTPNVYPTPGAVNVCTAPVVINEVVAPSSAAGTAELKNVTGATISLDGWGVASDSGIVWLDGTSLAPGAYRTVTLPAGTTGVGLWKDTSPAPHDVFRSYVVDGYQWSQPPPTSYGRCPDGSGGFTVTSAATLGAANLCPTLQNQAPPVIAGTARVGETLSLASAGTWSPSPDSRSYQWLADGLPITDATGTSLVLGPAQAGAVITVREIATGNGSTAVADSNPLGPVEPGAITNTAPPAITGEPSVGSTLSVSPGAWSPEGVDLAYQWLVGDHPVDGATASTYTVRSEDIGQPVTARVTASRTGYSPVSVTTDPTAPVAGGFQLTSAPTISGIPTVGKPLTATPGTWDPTPAATTYQWRSDGVEIPDATGAAYTPTAADVGRFLSVVVVVTSPGYADGRTVVTTTTPVQLGTIKNSDPPVVSGVPKAGHTLTASVGRWSTTPDTVEYQWFDDQGRITGATGRKLVLDRQAFLGEEVWVRVKVSAAGFSPATKASRPVGPVAKAQPEVTDTWSTKEARVGRTKVKVDLLITAPGDLHVSGTVSLEVDGRVVDTKKAGDTSLELVAPPFQQQGKHKLVVEYGGNALLTRWRDSVYVTAVR